MNTSRERERKSNSPRNDTLARCLDVKAHASVGRFVALPDDRACYYPRIADAEECRYSPWKEAERVEILRGENVYVLSCLIHHLSEANPYAHHAEDRCGWGCRVVHYCVGTICV